MISIIVPCYNEETNLEKAYQKLRNLYPKAELIIFDDNSKDRTLEIAKSIAKKDKNLKLIHSSSRKGKGASLNISIKKAKNNFVVFTDADLSANPKHIKEIDYWLTQGYQIVVGSRWHEKTKRSLKRTIISLVFNLGTRLVSGSKIKDHQCGLKGFNKKELLKLIPLVKDKRFFWDAELLIKAQWIGMKIKEIPVEWKEQKNTTINFSKDIKDMLRAQLRILNERKTFKKQN